MAPSETTKCCCACRTPLLDSAEIWADSAGFQHLLSLGADTTCTVQQPRSQYSCKTLNGPCASAWLIDVNVACCSCCRPVQEGVAGERVRIEVGPIKQRAARTFVFER